MSNHRKLLGTTFVLSLLSKAIELPAGYLSSYFLSIIITDAMSQNLVKVIRNSVLFFILIIGIHVISTVATYKFEKYTVTSLQTTRLSFITSFLSNSLDVLNIKKHGNIIENLNNDITAVYERASHILPSLIISIISVCIYLLLLFVNPLSAIIILLMSLLHAITPWASMRLFSRNYSNNRDIESEITEHYLNGLSGIEQIKANNLKAWYINKLKEYHKVYMRIGNISEATAVSENAINNFVSLILKFGSYVLVGVFILQNRISIGDSIKIITLSIVLFDSVRTAFSALPGMSISKAAKHRLDASLPSAISVENQMVCNNDILIDNVVFKYEDAKDCIINSLKLSIDKNQRIRLCGDNGAGKSTLLKLIVGILIPQSGKITIGNVLINNLSVDNFIENIFYLPQEDMRLSIAINDLLSFYKEKICDDARAVLYKMGFSQDDLSIKEIRDLSGGECRKLYISLLIAADPTIAILDEPTNYLDNASKKILIEYLDSRAGTTIITTHNDFGLNYKTIDLNNQRKK